MLAPALVAPAWLHTLGAWSSITIVHVRAAVAEWGLWAPLTSVLVMVINTFLPFPADFLIAANGAVFGFWGGISVSIVGAMVSACLAFGIARLVGRAVALRVVPSGVLAWIDHTVTQGGWWAVLLVQFSPLPYSLMNFVLGLTPISWATFLWVTFLSILPTNIVLSLLGYGLAETRPIFYWTVVALLLVALLTIWLQHRLAQLLKIPTKLPSTLELSGTPPAKEVT
ncbi:MAG TPA: hypothetical protein DEP35_04235 [Deltaproteobacteria bacterium]|jgi:uncharacterized membrane protein YdjX (TVP38/TMEM64 family)|nr:hypothetical protein [Deltaproteobacteria bacterium]